MFSSLVVLNSGQYHFLKQIGDTVYSEVPIGHFNLSAFVIQDGVCKTLSGTVIVPNQVINSVFEGKNMFAAYRSPGGIAIPLIADYNAPINYLKDFKTLLVDKNGKSALPMRNMPNLSFATGVAYMDPALISQGNPQLCEQIDNTLTPNEYLATIPNPADNYTSLGGTEAARNVHEFAGSYKMEIGKFLQNRVQPSSNAIGVLTDHIVQRYLNGELQLIFAPVSTTGFLNGQIIFDTTEPNPILLPLLQKIRHADALMKYRNYLFDRSLENFDSLLALFRKIQTWTSIEYRNPIVWDFYFEQIYRAILVANSNEDEAADQCRFATVSNDYDVLNQMASEILKTQPEPQTPLNNLFDRGITNVDNFYKAYGFSGLLPQQPQQSQNPQMNWDALGIPSIPTFGQANDENFNNNPNANPSGNQNPSGDQNPSGNQNGNQNENPNNAPIAMQYNINEEDTDQRLVENRTVTFTRNNTQNDGQLLERLWTIVSPTNAPFYLPYYKGQDMIWYDAINLQYYSGTVDVNRNDDLNGFVDLLNNPAPVWGSMPTSFNLVQSGDSFQVVIDRNFARQFNDYALCLAAMAQVNIIPGGFVDAFDAAANLARNNDPRMVAAIRTGGYSYEALATAINEIGTGQSSGNQNGNPSGVQNGNQNENPSGNQNENPTGQFPDLGDMHLSKHSNPKSETSAETTNNAETTNVNTKRCLDKLSHLPGEWAARVCKFLESKLDPNLPMENAASPTVPIALDSEKAIVQSTGKDEIVGIDGNDPVYPPVFNRLIEHGIVFACVFDPQKHAKHFTLDDPHQGLTIDSNGHLQLTILHRETGQRVICTNLE